jgi:hypothetical protein
MRSGVLKALPSFRDGCLGVDWGFGVRFRLGWFSKAGHGQELLGSLSCYSCFVYMYMPFATIPLNNRKQFLGWIREGGSGMDRELYL